MDASSKPSLLSFLAEIPDPRSRHGRQHSLSAVSGLVCCAVMCGARGRSTGVTNIAEALRRNASRVDDLFAKLGIFKQ